MVRISRRQALVTGMMGGVAGCATSFGGGQFQAAPSTATTRFAHGVASGDPDVTSVVLWTRITTDATTIPVMVEIATDAEFGRIVRTVQTETSGARDHTVKVLAEGLEPGLTYYYRFTTGEDVSPTGRTKTLPLNTNSVRFAVCSCSNYPFGYFNGYDHMARRDDLDAVIHLGDYIYEYGPDGYGAEDGVKLGRQHAPAKEIVSLEDYRMRHAQYKSDPSTQAMHGAHPFIAIWDDHETTNNSWENGAENHQPATEGDWETRRRAALQAYYEWMPVRDPEPGRARESLYKSYRFGNLLTLTAIETRLTARTKQLEYSEVVPTLKSPEDIERFKREVLGAEDRYLLGDAQLDYIETAFKQSLSRNEPWRVVANQVIMAEVTPPPLGDYVTEEDIVEVEKEWASVRDFIAFAELGLPLNLDAWDGYPAARERFYDMAKRQGARDLVVLTGDTHEAWANELAAADGTRMGVELGATGITSPGTARYLGDRAFDLSLLIRKDNPQVRWHDPLHNGYFVLELEEDRGRVDFISLGTITSQDYDTAVAARFDLIKRDGTVELSRPRGLGFKERVLF